MIKKEELIKLIDKYDRQAEKAYMNYQETGIPRYDRERRNAEDLADALRVALGAADEHTAYINLKGEVIRLATRADRMTQEEIKAQELFSLLKDLISLAVMSCSYRRLEE